MAMFKNRQTMFTAMMKALKEQGWRRGFDARPWRVGCQYLAPETGFRCAVGGLVPRDKYDPSFETVASLNSDGHVKLWVNEAGNLVEMPEHLALRKAAGIPKKLIAFAAAVQRVHDLATDCTLKEKMQEFARNNNLKWEV